MPVVKTVTEGNVTTEIIDLTEGKGHLSTDEILAKTGGKAGEHVEVGPDGKTYTYSVEVEEVKMNFLVWKIFDFLFLKKLTFAIFLRRTYFGIFY